MRSRSRSRIPLNASCSSSDIFVFDSVNLQALTMLFLVLMNLADILLPFGSVHTLQSSKVMLSSRLVDTR